MVVRLNDGTQDFITDYEKCKSIAEEKLGKEFAACWDEMVDARIQSAIDTECESCEHCEDD